jgi:hypothetical protein
MNIPAAVKADPEYQRDYERGWRASHNYPDSIENNGGPSILERADNRNETDAWYDGYGDWACGNPKWHSAEDRLS